MSLKVQLSVYVKLFCDSLLERLLLGQVVFSLNLQIFILVLYSFKLLELLRVSICFQKLKMHSLVGIVNANPLPSYDVELQDVMIGKQQIYL